MQQQLELIEEENYDKKRPQSAKNIHNVITTKDTDKYTKLDEKHKGIKNLIENTEVNNIIHKNKPLGKGCFNEFFKINDKIGFRVPQAGTNAFNKDFNTIFVSTLLEICGEKTIDSGKEQNGTYCDLGKKNLFDKTVEVLTNHSLKLTVDTFKSFGDDKDSFYRKFNPNERTTIEAFLIMYIFSTSGLEIQETELKKQKGILQKICLDEQDLIFTSRVLCKVFLLQMFDRKPNNTVVFEDNDGKIDFCEIDFDDIQGINNSFASTIFCQIVSSNKILQKEAKKQWNTKLQCLINNYKDLTRYVQYIEKSFKDMIKNYTMTPQKIEELIKKTALKAKYMGLSEQEVIKGINEKIKLWTDMLNDKENGDVVNQIEGIKKSREQTLKALKQIKKENVGKIVEDVMMFHDFTYDKPHFKDDNDVIGKEHKKTNEDIASKAEEMVLAEKHRISRMQKQASFIRRFVSDGREIQTGNITAENLISYFKLEKDRSRSFFWMFGQRNKRFNALCRELEKLGINNPENLFIGNKNYMEDEKQIRDLFDEQQQGNNQQQAIINNRPQQNIQQIRQRIADRLNQVGCCSFG